MRGRSVTPISLQGGESGSSSVALGKRSFSLAAISTKSSIGEKEFSKKPSLPVPLPTRKVNTVTPPSTGIAYVKNLLSTTSVSESFQSLSVPNTDSFINQIHIAGESASMQGGVIQQHSVGSGSIIDFLV